MRSTTSCVPRPKRELAALRARSSCSSATESSCGGTTKIDSPVARDDPRTTTRRSTWAARHRGARHAHRSIALGHAVLLDTVLAKAGVVAEDVGEVVTPVVERDPSFRALLAKHFPRSRVRDAAAFTSVAAGLAMPGAQEAVGAA